MLFGNRLSTNLCFFNLVDANKDSVCVFGNLSSLVASGQSPHPHVVLDNRFVSTTTETFDRAQLTVNVFLVLKDCNIGKKQWLGGRYCGGKETSTL